MPVRAIFGWSGTLGRPARRARRGDRLRPAARSGCCSCSAGGCAGPTLGRRARLRVGRLPVHAVRAERNTNDTLVALLLVLALLVITLGARRAGRVGGAGRADQVRAAGARAAARYAAIGARRPRERAARLASSWSRSRRRRAGRDAARCCSHARPAHDLAAHDRLPGRPRLAVLGLGALRAGWASSSTLVQGAAVALALGARVRARAAATWSSSRRWRAAILIARPARARPLVLPLHPVVLPARDGRAARRLPERGARAACRLACAGAAGGRASDARAGSSTCSIESARSGSRAADQHAHQPRVLLGGLEARPASA